MTLNFEKYAQEGNRFLNNLAEKLGCPGDIDRTANVLRAVLNALRDVLRPAKNIQLTAQLPMCLKAIYVDGYMPQQTKDHAHYIEDFLAIVLTYLERSAPHDFRTVEELEHAVQTVLNALRQYVPVGEMEDITARLPKEIKQFISRAIARVEAYDYF